MDKQIYQFLDPEGNIIERLEVDVPKPTELRDFWCICTSDGVIISMQQFKIGRGKPEDMLVNHADKEGVCCFQISKEEFHTLYETAKASLENGQGYVDSDFLEGRRFVLGKVNSGKISKTLDSENLIDIDIEEVKEKIRNLK